VTASLEKGAIGWFLKFQPFHDIFPPSVFSLQRPGLRSRFGFFSCYAQWGRVFTVGFTGVRLQGVRTASPPALMWPLWKGSVVPCGHQKLSRGSILGRMVFGPLRCVSSLLELLVGREAASSFILPNKQQSHVSKILGPLDFPL